MKRPSVLAFVLVLMFAVFARAESFHKDLPGGVLTASEARKLGKTKTIYSCEKVKQGPNKPKKVTGSKPTYHSAVGEALDDVGDILDVKGGRAFRCKPVEYDKSKAAFVKADDE